MKESGISLYFEQRFFFLCQFSHKVHHHFQFQRDTLILARPVCKQARSTSFRQARSCKSISVEHNRYILTNINRFSNLFLEVKILSLFLYLRFLALLPCQIACNHIQPRMCLPIPLGCNVQLLRWRRLQFYYQNMTQRPFGLYL